MLCNFLYLVLFQHHKLLYFDNITLVMLFVSRRICVGLFVFIRSSAYAPSCVYGANDAFPKYIHLELYTVIGGQVKYRVLEKFDESNNSAKIQPLAQNDVILTFCKGISNYFLYYVPQKAAEIINAKIDALPATFTDDQKNFLKTH